MLSKTLPLILFGLSASAVAADVFGSGEHQFSMAFVEIGNPGNPTDPNLSAPLGSVAYSYRMGTHEVSRGMIASYNALSGGPQLTIEDAASPWISPESPATKITWNECARFVNWLNTSSGFEPAYKFTTDGAVDDIELWTVGDSGYDSANPTRNRNAHYFLPTEDEWHKAAFYDPGARGGAGAYWRYATGSDTKPLAVSGGAASGTAVFGQELSDGPAPIKNAGGLSPYGTMAQCGNVSELLESPFMLPNNPGIYRAYNPGSWWSSALFPPSSRLSNNGLVPSGRNTFTGFRVASAAMPAESLIQMSNLSKVGRDVTIDLVSTVGGGTSIDLLTC
ncbi:MAG: SUMF1/EgtB/PvdO family nonheme iron enzyme [Akkermansiaceae bacterium]|nr:SUMF1/EgtB/PvdO family nonheme iron enzyme [Akkermansiaceae bacterium]